MLERIPIDRNSDDFVFDNQMLAQILWHGYTIAEITCPTRYMPEASSIGFSRAVRYGCGCRVTAAEYRLARHGLIRSQRFNP